MKFLAFALVAVLAPPLVHASSEDTNLPEESVGNALMHWLLDEHDVTARDVITAQCNHDRRQWKAREVCESRHTREFLRALDVRDTPFGRCMVETCEDVWGELEELAVSSRSRGEVDAVVRENPTLRRCPFAADHWREHRAYGDTGATFATAMAIRAVDNARLSYRRVASRSSSAEIRVQTRGYKHDFACDAEFREHVMDEGLQLDGDTLRPPP